MNLDDLGPRLSGHLSRWLVAIVLLPPILYSMWADE